MCIRDRCYDRTRLRTQRQRMAKGEWIRRTAAGDLARARGLIRAHVRRAASKATLRDDDAHVYAAVD